jgi:pyruvate dehydrogenase E2 component (dihydrolipoamide acetyltransferase)
MAIEMIMPKVDKEQETGTVVEWLKTDGQQVQEGETILVIETDKIAIDVESPGTGTLAGITAYPGDIIPVGTVIAYILAEGEEIPERASRAVDIPDPDLPAPSLNRSGEQIPLIGIRRTISERVTESYRSIPHIQFQATVDMTNFNKARKDYNDLATLRGDGTVSVTALLVKLVAMTLVDHPWLNSSLQDDVIHLHEEINIGLAVALDKGLIAPVVKNADHKGIREIAVESSDLITRAREGTLTSGDVKGATFTISNLGPFGVEQFNALINPPQVGILAIGATAAEAVAMEGGAIAIRPIMRFTLSVDHRVVDGAIAARFIADLKAILENPTFVNY